MIIPKFLQDISEPIKASKNTETIRIKCNCGHSHFYLYNNIVQDDLAVKSKFNEVINEDGKLYLVKRNFFGKIKERIECDQTFYEKQRRVFKVKCEKCSKEHIIYDNYQHGYAAIIDKLGDNNLVFDEPIKYKLQYPQPIEVYLKIYQDLSYDEFNEELDFETYLCAFSNIDIYGVNCKSKKLKIYSEETA